MTKILYGAPVKDKIKEILAARTKILKKRPVLAIVQVGYREDSNVYIRNKIKFGEEIGARVVLKNFKIERLKDYKKLEEELISEIEKLNADKNVDGIIVQLPLPENLNTEKIINTVLVEKDADGLVSEKIVSATARGVMTLLEFYEIELKNKKVAVIGQGILAGKPIADELEKKGAEVFRCDINTKNIPEIAKQCDILISAVGKPGLITKEFVNERQVVVDVGTSKMGDKLVGDVNFEEVEPLVYAITPVPGGVGPLTVCSLFQNLLDLISIK
ncbi:MAG: bifunctional 5,10-methylenetetrahydrofolate dehydrogenase/5,10-methenyltetrahydrofolate cyclohydrolase [Patescibacteria group bacterium]|nr:bifunctional 5,10-methylenetetrahydrofolate dehydrogenase/5,10-methenyltetrahydrofolate cyclohydrolase [Patescibacteria group bacterium]